MNSRVPELDLHGVRHRQVDRLVENFIFLNSPPVCIITGCSTIMQALVLDVIKRHEFGYNCDVGSIMVFTS